MLPGEPFGISANICPVRWLPKEFLNRCGESFPVIFGSEHTDTFIGQNFRNSTDAGGYHRCSRCQCFADDVWNTFIPAGYRQNICTPHEGGDDSRGLIAEKMTVLGYSQCCRLFPQTPKKRAVSCKYIFDSRSQMGLPAQAGGGEQQSGIFHWCQITDKENEALPVSDCKGERGRGWRGLRMEQIEINPVGDGREFRWPNARVEQQVLQGSRSADNACASVQISTHHVSAYWHTKILVYICALSDREYRDAGMSPGNGLDDPAGIRIQPGSYNGIGRPCFAELRQISREAPGDAEMVEKGTEFGDVGDLEELRVIGCVFRTAFPGSRRRYNGKWPWPGTKHSKSQIIFIGETARKTSVVQTEGGT